MSWCSTFWILLPVLSVHGLVRRDLTHVLTNETWYWPGVQRGFQLNILSKGYIQNGVWLQTDELCTGVHVGTHMDAPAHFSPSGWTVDEIPIEHLIVPVIVVDIRNKTSRDPDSSITRADLEQWETKHSEIPKGCVVLQCSGWSEMFQKDKAGFWGNDRDDVSDFHFPYFSMDAMEFLVKERAIVGVGLETPSLDIGVSSTYPVHVLATSHNIYILENVKDVCFVPAIGATVYVLPPPYVGASGAPVRILASWEDVTGGANVVKHANIMALLVCIHLILQLC